VEQAIMKTRVPIRIINGPGDAISGRHVCNRYIELTSRLSDVVFLSDDIGHYPHVEDRIHVMQHILQFHQSLT